jgi:hypothetical protein
MQARRRPRLSTLRRRFAPQQLRHAHAVELAHEGVPLNVIQRQLGHTTSALSICRASTMPRSSPPSTPARHRCSPASTRLRLRWSPLAPTVDRTELLPSRSSSMRLRSCSSSNSAARSLRAVRLLLRHGDSDGAQAASDRELARVEVVPRHRMHLIRPGGVSVAVYWESA